MKIVLIITTFVLGILCLLGILAAGVEGGFLGVSPFAWYAFSFVTGSVSLCLALYLGGDYA